MRRTPIVIILVLAISQTGCPMVDFKELQFTHNRPAESDIIGTWTPTSETLREIKDRGHYPPANHALILRADHTFSMTDMPDWWSNGFGESHGKFEYGQGTWDLQADKDLWQIWIVRLRFPNFYSSVNLYRQKPPYSIFIRVGDPNDGYAMFFARKA